MREVLPSVHLLEIFMPYLYYESMMLETIRRVVDKDYYRGLEIPIFSNTTAQNEIRSILKQNALCGTAYSTPYMDRKNYNLSSMNKELRTTSIDYVLKLLDRANKMGLSYVGLPSGPDPGVESREECKELLLDSFYILSKRAADYGISILLEPLDRYAHKKKLLGPMDESCQWLTQLRTMVSNVFIHWDSAHEALGEMDIFQSLVVAAPYLARIHLSNAILQRDHPCFGDLHMDVGEPPTFQTDGFLDVSLGGQIVKEATRLCDGGTDKLYVSVEVLGHPGDDLWHKEYCSHMFLMECMGRAGL